MKNLEEIYIVSNGDKVEVRKVKNTTEAVDTVRKRIDPTQSVLQLIMMMSEGNPGAVNVISQMLKQDDVDGVFMLLHLDDMNIRGTQIWIGYKDHCKQDIKAFMECVKKRDKDMIEVINKQGLLGNHDQIAVKHGGSYNGGRKLFTKEQRDAAMQKLQ